MIRYWYPLIRSLLLVSFAMLLRTTSSMMMLRRTTTTTKAALLLHKQHLGLDRRGRPRSLFLYDGA